MWIWSCHAPLKNLPGVFRNSQNKIRLCYHGIRDRSWPGLGLPSSFLSGTIPTCNHLPATQTFLLFLKHTKFLSAPLHLLFPVPITLALKLLRWPLPSSPISAQSFPLKSASPTPPTMPNPPCSHPLWHNPDRALTVFWMYLFCFLICLLSVSFSLAPNRLQT